MASEEDALIRAKRNYITEIRKRIENLKTSIDSAKEAETFQEFLAVKRDTFVTFLKDYPRDSTTCPYCLFFTDPITFVYNCNVCSYANTHKPCINAQQNSDYQEMCKNISELIDAVNKCWTQLD